MLMVAKAKSTVFRILIIAAAWAMCGSGLSVAHAQIRVAVTPLEADPGLQRYTAYARGELENLIMGFGNVAIVERARMDQMTKELSFGNFSGITDATQVASFGKMAGASILVTGSLLKADTETRGFTGFGISTGQAQTTATIRVRAYDVEKGTVVYSSTATGSTSSFRTNFGGAGKTDQASAAIEDAMKNGVHARGDGDDKVDESRLPIVGKVGGTRAGNAYHAGTRKEAVASDPRLARRRARRRSPDAGGVGPPARPLRP